MKQLATIVGLLTAVAPVTAAAEMIFDGKDRVQAYIGVTEIEDQTGTLQTEVGEPAGGGPVDIDFANLFTLGIEVETPMHSRDEGFEWGVNTGGGFGWKGSDTRFAGSVSDGQGTVAFRVDNEMLLLEGHIGPYFRLHLGKKVDFYASGGPAIIYGQHDVDDEESDDPEDALTAGNGVIILGDDSDSDVIFGYYARAGLEFDLGAGKQWGVGVRYLGGEMEFNDTVGEFDLEALQLLITYSAWF